MEIDIKSPIKSQIGKSRIRNRLSTLIWKKVTSPLDSTVFDKIDWPLWNKVYSRVWQVVDVKVNLQVSVPIRLQYGFNDDNHEQ